MAYLAEDHNLSSELEENSVRIDAIIDKQHGVDQPRKASSLDAVSPLQLTEDFAMRRSDESWNLRVLRGPPNGSTLCFLSTWQQAPLVLSRSCTSLSCTVQS